MGVALILGAGVTWEWSERQHRSRATRATAVKWLPFCDPADEQAFVRAGAPGALGPSADREVSGEGR